MRTFILSLAVSMLVGGCAIDTVIEPGPKRKPALAILNLDQLLTKLEHERVIFVGEIHNHYGHHLNQLAVVQGLYRQNRQLAIGMEYFQHPFQASLDAYSVGKIDIRELLKQTEYYDRWRFDIRHYLPILKFARLHKIPLIALSVAREISDKVSHSGFASLDPVQRQHIADRLDRSDLAYLARLRQIFEQHKKQGENLGGSQEADRELRAFERFVDVQLLWDEGMAARAADFLKRHPEERLVILAGQGHIAYGSGIPQRLLRRLNIPMASVLTQDVSTQDQSEIDPLRSDFYLATHSQVRLPAAGKLGILLHTDTNNVRIQGFTDSSHAETAGLRAADQITMIDDHKVTDYTDLKLALLHKQPEDTVLVKVIRDNKGKPTDTEYNVVLY